uniref:BPL/LPL catalytic domain-containing protein n=1 Tax=Ciona savignyi TaxID=51511 RepID=H2ZC70_CIOSA
MNTPLGKCLPFLQLITSAAVVTGIRSIEGLQDVDLTIKWPNDIYHGKQVKLGGVLVQSTMLHDVFYVSIGCGVNIANSMPTVCLNKILRDDYAMQRQLSTEEVIAKTISQLENLIADFQRNGPESFLKLYYKYWLHNLAEVTVQDENGSKVECTVAGVDEFGFLRVRRHDNGEVVTLNPDGNSFDLMKNQIFSKRIKK